jgi:transposase
MAPQSKRYRRSRSALAMGRQAIKQHKYWNDQVNQFDETKIANKRGRSRLKDENKMILLAIRSVLRTYLEFVDSGYMCIDEISWTKIYLKVSEDFHVRRHHVRWLHQNHVDGDGSVLTFGKKRRGPKMEVHQKLEVIHTRAICDLADRYHGNGRTITNRIVRNYLAIKFNIKISRSAVSMYFGRLGLTWKKISNKKRNPGNYRVDLMRSFLIDYSKLYNEFINDPEGCPFIFVYTDESYIHKMHCGNFSYLPENVKEINRSNNKGDRLIIIHAITPFGPVAEYDDNNEPVCELEWISEGKFEI